MAKKELPVETKYKPLFSIKKTEEIPKIPAIKDKTQVDITYDLIAPYVKAHIHWDAKESELLYEVIEPKLTDEEKKILETLESGIEELINISFIAIKSVEVVIEFLEKNIKVLLSELGIKISKETFLKLMYYIYRDFVGLNEIEPMMNDYYIEDIECNGSNTPIYIVHRKLRNLRTNIILPTNKVLTKFVEKLAQKAGKYISFASPILDGRLPDGSRVNATYTQEISARGPTFTIRKFTKIPWSPIQLMQFRTLSPEILAYLWMAVEHESNFIVIGGTGSGKTTMLNNVAFFIPPAQRIVSIEDTHELNLLHENWLPSVARPGMGTGEVKHGEVSLFDLLKGSFRQRPDYVIVGEIRGKEAYVLFQGAASGHATMSTMHAEDVETMIKRLETKPIDLSPALVKMLNIVCVMSQSRVKGNVVRRLKTITEIIDVDPQTGEAKVEHPFTWDPKTDRFYFSGKSRLFEKISTQYGMSIEQVFNEFNLRARLLMALYNKKVFDFKEVHHAISAYYKKPQEILKKYGII